MAGLADVRCGVEYCRNMRRCLWLFLLFCSSFPRILSAQQAVPAAARYYRLICLVHLTGSGEKGDRIRPEVVGDLPAADRKGIVAWKMIPSDDGKMALVHLVALDPHVFDALRADKRPEVRVFEIGRQGKDEIERELKKFRKDFDLTKFEVEAQ